MIMVAFPAIHLHHDHHNHDNNDAGAGDRTYQTSWSFIAIADQSRHVQNHQPSASPRPSRPLSAACSLSTAPAVSTRNIFLNNRSNRQSQRRDNTQSRCPHLIAGSIVQVPRLLHRFWQHRRASTSSMGICGISNGIFLYADSIIYHKTVFQLLKPSRAVSAHDGLTNCGSALDHESFTWKPSRNQSPPETSLYSQDTLFLTIGVNKGTIR